MKRLVWIALGIVALAVVAVRSTVGADAPVALTPQQPVLLQRAPGSFDYLNFDDQMRRLLVAHTGSRTFDVVDVNNNDVLRQESVGEGHGVAVDIKDGKYFVGTSRPPAVVVVNRKFMVKDDQIAAGGPIDAIAFDPKNDMLYADRNDNQVVVIAAKANKVYTTIPINGGLEYIVYDPASDRIYQNVESANVIAVIDPNSNKVLATWPVAPATAPHGLAIDSATHRLFSAGANGKLAVVDATSGSVIASADISPSVDQIAFDPGTRRVYCASGVGVLSVVQETDTGAEHIADITVPRRTHSVTVDPTTHAVWITYGAEDNDYTMKLVPAAASPSPSR